MLATTSTISLQKTNVLGQDVDTPPVIIIDNYQLEVIHEFTYLGSSDWLNRVGGWVVRGQVAGRGLWALGCRSCLFEGK